MNQTDLRVLRSKKMIRAAFLELMAEKGYTHVTITDIAERAMINRKTFYNRFASIEALLDEILNETVGMVLIDPAWFCSNSGHDHERVSRGDEIRRFLKNLSGHKATLQALFGDVYAMELNLQVEASVRLYVAQRLAVACQPKCDLSGRYPLDLLSCLIASASIVFIKWWLDQDDYTEEDAALLLEDILMNINGVTLPLTFQPE